MLRTPGHLPASPQTLLGFGAGAEEPAAPRKGAEGLAGETEARGAPEQARMTPRLFSEPSRAEAEPARPRRHRPAPGKPPRSPRLGARVTTRYCCQPARVRAAGARRNRAERPGGLADAGGGGQGPDPRATGRMRLLTHTSFPPPRHPPAGGPRTPSASPCPRGRRRVQLSPPGQHPAPAGVSTGRRGTRPAAFGSALHACTRVCRGGYEGPVSNDLDPRRPGQVAPHRPGNATAPPPQHLPAPGTGGGGHQPVTSPQLSTEEGSGPQGAQRCREGPAPHCSALQEGFAPKGLSTAGFAPPPLLSTAGRICPPHCSAPREGCGPCSPRGPGRCGPAARPPAALTSAGTCGLQPGGGAPPSQRGGGRGRGLRRRPAPIGRRAGLRLQKATRSAPHWSAPRGCCSAICIFKEAAPPSPPKDPEVYGGGGMNP